MTSRNTNLLRSLPFVLTGLLLMIAPLILRLTLGRGWELSASLVVVGAWLVIRPWRFCAFSDEERRQARRVGTGVLIFLAALYAVGYVAH